MRHIHFIGICGVAMSALALAFKKQGWKVTGSDVGFYPPISTHLKDSGVDYYPGWHPEKMGKPDLVVVGNVAGSTNPEWLYVQEHKLNYKSYPEVIAEYFVKQNSIVCAGTYGKTTSTALMTWILKEAGWDPSYMFGGLMATPTDRAYVNTPLRQGGETPPLPSADISDSGWSILEGDEYKTSRWDNKAKFFHYSPTHLLLTSVVWDHADVYPTEEVYVEAFKKLIELVPESGLKVISEKAIPMLNEHPPRPPLRPRRTRLWREGGNNKSPLEGGSRGMLATITYGKSPTNDYIYSNITQSKSGIAFNITHRNQTYRLTCPSLGEFMADNATGCFALANEIGIAPEKIISAIATFPGMKRRLEKRYEGNITVFDDIAHSPTKAKAILESLRHIYVSPLPASRRGEGQRVRARIFAIFEPNTGNRRSQAKPWYDHCFDAADEIIIPKLTKIKIDPNDPDKPFEGDELAHIISHINPRVQYIEEDEKLITYLQQKTQPCDVVVFLGSHGFRGMIETLILKMDS